MVCTADVRTGDAVRSIGNLLKRLATRPAVVGLVRYGARRADAPAGTGGDFDLFVLVEQRPPELESLHFVVGGVPVDLNVRTWHDLERAAGGEPLTPIDRAVFDGEVLHDRDEDLAARLALLRAQSQSSSPARLPPEHVVAFVRFGHRHALDKVRGRLEAEPVLCRLVLEANLYWLIENYFRLRGLPFPGERGALRHLERHGPALWAEIQRFYATDDLRERSAIGEAMGERVLAPVGGLWERGEVLALGTAGPRAVTSHGDTPGGPDLQARGQRFLRDLLDAWPEP